MASKKFNLGEFLSQRTKTEKTLGFATAFVVFFGIMQGVVIGPILTKMNTIDSDISQSRDEIRRDRRILSFKDRILDEYAKSSAYLDSTDTSSEEIIATLLKKIENSARDHSIVVKDIRPGDTEVKPQFKIYKTSMDCEGTLSNLLALMNTLEQSDYLFQITRYSLEPKSKGADILKATLDIARYLIPAEKLGPALQSGFEAKAMMPSVSSSAGSSQSNDIPEFPDMPVTQSK